MPRKPMKFRGFCIAVALNTASLFALSSAGWAITIAPTEDVMASPFFTGMDLIRGYAGDGRGAHRVSTADPFGLGGSETIYLDFSSFDFGSVDGPVVATLTVESVDGGFGANADSANPFLVSAHGVDSDPLSSILDDTNPGGTTNWLEFEATNVLPADAAAMTLVTGFGAVHFDVTALVHSWISGSNPNHAIALSGRNQAPGTDFLHGFANQSESPSSTYLTLTVVPEPGTGLLLMLGLGGLACRRPHGARRAAFQRNEGSVQ